MLLELVRFPCVANSEGLLVKKLMLAAYHGHAELVGLLIQHGADPNRVNDRGQSPLAGAVFKKEDAVIEVRFFYRGLRIISEGLSGALRVCVRESGLSLLYFSPLLLNISLNILLYFPLGIVGRGR